MRKTRTVRMIVAGLLALALLLLAAGCVVSPATQTAPAPTTQVIQSSVTPLPSLCTSVEVQSYPSSAFRLKILVKNSAGKPAPDARLFITFPDSGEAPVQMHANDRGYAVLDLYDAKLTLPDAHGRTSGTLSFFITATWERPNGDVEYLSTCGSQDIDLLIPSEIAVTVNLPR